MPTPLALAVLALLLAVLAAPVVAAPAVERKVPEPPILVCVELMPDPQALPLRRGAVPVIVPDSFWDTYEEAAARRHQIVTEGWIGSTRAEGGEEEYGPSQIRRAVLGPSDHQEFCAPPGTRR